MLQHSWQSSHPKVLSVSTECYKATTIAETTKNWTQQKSKQVIWSDELPFKVFQTVGRAFISLKLAKSI